jgi:hypothetical protein
MSADPCKQLCIARALHGILLSPGGDLPLMWKE